MSNIFENMRFLGHMKPQFENIYFLLLSGKNICNPNNHFVYPHAIIHSFPDWEQDSQKLVKWCQSGPQATAFFSSHAYPMQMVRRSLMSLGCGVGGPHWTLLHSSPCWSVSWNLLQCWGSENEYWLVLKLRNDVKCMGRF